MRAHGTRAKYVVEKCRCADCRGAARDYERMRTRRKAYGFEPYADAEKARQHVRWLMSQGIGWKRIAQEAGVPTGAVSKLLYGDSKRGMAPSKRIRVTTGRKLLAVRPNVIAPGARIDATHAKGLLRVLLDAGWSKTAVAERVGTTCGNLLRSDECTVKTARVLEALVRDELEPPADCRPKQNGGAYGAVARDRAVRDKARRDNEAERRRQYRSAA